MDAGAQRERGHLWERGGATGERHSKLIQRSLLNSEINIPRNHFHRLFHFIARSVAKITRERKGERDVGTICKGRSIEWSGAI